MKKKILLLEDDANLGTVLQEHLEMNGFDATLCVNGEKGLEAISGSRYDLCLIDIMMPRMDGFSFAREVRKQDKTVPLIFLTARSLKEDKVEGFRIGCDDYITKPFSIEELLLRIGAVLRRSGPTGEAETSDICQIGTYSFDRRRQLLKSPEKEYKLTPKESELLDLLCQHMNRTLLRETALRQIWGDESYFSGRSMDVFVSKLRKYLQDDKQIELLGIRGKGLRLLVN